MKNSVLTISAHSNGYTFFQSAILTPVAVDAQYGTLLIFGARPILYLLLYAAPEKALQQIKMAEVISRLVASAALLQQLLLDHLANSAAVHRAGAGLLLVLGGRRRHFQPIAILRRRFAVGAIAAAEFGANTPHIESKFCDLVRIHVSHTEGWQGGSQRDYHRIAHTPNRIAQLSYRIARQPIVVMGRREFEHTESS